MIAGHVANIRARLPELTVAVYLLLGSLAWVWGLATVTRAWHPALTTFLIVWMLAAVGLVLRRRGGWGVLLLIEWLALWGWVDEPGEWGRFALQVALVLLLVSTPMQRWVPLPTRDKPQRLGRVFILTASGFLVWAVVEAVNGDAAAIPLLAMALAFFIFLRTARATTTMAGLASASATRLSSPPKD